MEAETKQDFIFRRNRFVEMVNNTPGLPSELIELFKARIETLDALLDYMNYT